MQKACDNSLKKRSFWGVRGILGGELLQNTSYSFKIMSLK
ncbi:hypothetical protein HMPREF1425_01228 [Helicobacter pylori GAM71Ai]|nr:hypothetical protein HMPREF1425_01228 [Helicobacter pylori GAM71Ai]